MCFVVAKIEEKIKGTILETIMYGVRTCLQCIDLIGQYGKRAFGYSVVLVAIVANRIGQQLPVYTSRCYLHLDAATEQYTEQKQQKTEKSALLTHTQNTHHHTTYTHANLTRRDGVNKTKSKSISFNNNVG